MAGSALLPVLLLMFLFSALALGASVVVRAELAIADRFRQSAEAFHAAEAAMELAISELRPMRTWVPVLEGAGRSAYSSGAFAGSQEVPGGGTIALCCGAASVAGRLSAETAVARRPARRRVEWRPFLWAPFNALVPQDPPSRLFVVIFIGEDDEEAGVAGSGDANETIVVRGEAVDPAGLRRSVEAVIGRRSIAPPEAGAGAPPGSPGAPPVVGIVSWREVR
jgi:hypothetical protein